jgi:hypothetical protein
MMNRQDLETLVAAMLIALSVAVYEEASASGDIDLEPKIAMAETGLPPHGNESDYPASSGRDNIVQMLTSGLSPGNVSISGPNGPETLPLWW